MLSDGGCSNTHLNHRWESASAKSQQYTSDHGSRSSSQTVIHSRCEGSHTRKVHFSDEQQLRTDSANGYQYPHDRHRLVPARDNQQFALAVDNKPLSTRCTWNVTGVRDAESYDAIPSPCSSSVERDQKPHSNITKPKHEVTFTLKYNAIILSAVLETLEFITVTTVLLLHVTVDIYQKLSKKEKSLLGKTIIVNFTFGAVPVFISIVHAYLLSC